METNGLSTKQLLEIIADSHRRMDRRSEENRKMIRELAAMNKQITLMVDRQDERMAQLDRTQAQLAGMQKDVALILNRQGDRLTRLENR